jgi:hypothetical protein
VFCVGQARVPLVMTRKEVTIQITANAKMRFANP